MSDPTLFQYCQKFVLFRDETMGEILLARRKDEADYNGTYSLIGGKLETSDGGFVEGLRREKNEEIGDQARVKVYPQPTYNVYFQKKSGQHMVLPHYVAFYIVGDIQLNEEYDDYKWVAVNQLDDFEPKIETIPAIVAWAQNMKVTLLDQEPVEI